MKFKKDILKAGLFVVNDGKGGRRVEHIPETRLKHWADQFQKMRAAGLNIPAPAFHNKSTPTPDKLSSKDNYGFWEHLTVQKSPDGKPVLHGHLDVPVETDAERVGNTVTETSIYAIPKYVDGNGNEWEDVLSHIALVTHPIEPGQSNFAPLEDGELSLQMSSFIATEMSDDELNNMMQDVDSINTTGDLYKMLEEVAGIAVEPGTPPTDLPRALMAALKQKQLCDNRQGAGSLSKPPKNSQLHEVPIIMSQQPVPSADRYNGTTTTSEHSFQMSQDQVNQIAQRNNLLMSMFADQKKQNLTARLNGIAKRGIITKEQFDQYAGQIATLEMSIDNAGKEIVSPVEHVINALSNVRVPAPANQPIVAMANQSDDGNYVIQAQTVPSYDPYRSPEVTDARAEEIVNNLMGGTNR